MNTIKDETLKNIAKRLEKTIESNQPKQIFNLLRLIMRQEKEYFRIFSPLSTIKLVIYIYSYKNFENFETADYIFKNLFFASLLKTENKLYEEGCDSCDGYGSVGCYDCDSTGNVECRECDGEGQITCEVCDGGELIDCESCGGSGEDEEGDTCTDCNGEGQVKCSDCDGKGITSCYSCSGDGSVECRECYGTATVDCENCVDGVIETHEIEYDVYEICSWDGRLFNILELKVNENEVALDGDSLADFEDDIIYLNVYEDHREFTADLEDDSYYCFGLQKIGELAEKNLKFFTRSGNDKKITLNHNISYFTT